MSASCTRACVRLPLLLVAALLVALTVLLADAGRADAAAPPNRNDPCSQAGRNICGTNGVGRHETYRYGIRWFGDFRRVMPDVDDPAFCIDLRFWYPSRAGRYAEMSAQRLRNRDGRAVPVVNQRKMAYALWKYGRSNAVNQQAAVMLYVHQMMGDGRPGEVDPSALGQAVVRLYNRIDAEATRLHGPYRMSVRMPERLVAGVPARAQVTLTSARGNPVANTVLTIDADNATAPTRVRTNARGVALVRFTPTAAARVRVQATTGDIASTLPRYFEATRAAERRNGQRLAVASAQQVSAAGAANAQKATIRVSTTARPDRLLVGEPNHDEIRLTGVPPTRAVRVTSLLYGPFRSREAITCDGEPYARSAVTAASSGTVRSPEVRPDRVGWYTYRVEIEGDDTLNPVATACGIPAETFVVETQPAVTTQVSEQQARPGAQIFDTVVVTGLSGENANVDVRLYGPFAARDAMSCDGAPAWTGTVTATGDGTYTTEPVTLTTPGYYTYTEAIAAQGFVRAQQSECGVVSETTVVMGTPAIRTQISNQATAPGARVTDTAVVSGLGTLRATVVTELWGPYPSAEAMTCTGTPYWQGTFTANGDGSYTSEPVTLDRAGYYTYRERIEPSEAHDGVLTECGIASQTTITTATPAVTTVASSEVLRPGGALRDTLRVRGLGRTPAVVEVELFGPFATRDAIRCNIAPVWRGEVRVNGDGTYRTAPVRLQRVGLYSYRERIRPSGLTKGFEGQCALVPETALVAPTINTGGAGARPGPTVAQRSNQAPARSRPVRVRSAQLGIDTAVLPAGINLRRGELAVPADIRRAGWWRDGAVPGERAGATLIAGHVDSARRGPGAFFPLKRARAGQRVQVTTADRRTRTYRITSVRVVLKDQLPTDIYSLRGRERLVLVTCGGRFDQASGHYRDNIVVTAVPV